MRRFFTISRLLIHVVKACFVTTCLFPFMNESQRKRYVRKWSKKLLDICRVSVRINNPEHLSPKALVVANHISWLDIFLIYTFVDGHFIAKADMARWPMIGRLARNVGTLFLERNSARHLKTILERLVTDLKEEERYIFFPEGTTSKQGQMLPFHPNLFEGAIHSGLPIQPFALRYINRQGQFEDAVDSHGDITFGESVISIIGKDYIQAELTILPLISSEGLQRKELSIQTQEAIISVLSQSHVAENRDRQPETRHDLQGVRL